jgi:hypothetical protein
LHNGSLGNSEKNEGNSNNRYNINSCNRRRNRRLCLFAKQSKSNTITDSNPDPNTITHNLNLTYPNTIAKSNRINFSYSNRKPHSVAFAISISNPDA